MHDACVTPHASIQCIFHEDNATFALRLDPREYFTRATVAVPVLSLSET